MSAQNGNRKWEIITVGEDLGGDVTQTLTFAKRRATRVDVQTYDRGVYVGPFGGSTLLFRVKTVAEFGAAFYTAGRDLRSELGQTRQIFLRVGEVKIPVIARILYLTEHLAGMEFVDPSSAARLAIRTHFFLEFIAASLPPIVQAVESGVAQVRKVSYGGELSVHGMEIVMNGDQIQSLEAGLGCLGAKVHWHRRGAIQVSLSTHEQYRDVYLRNQLICFLRNLKGLNARVARAIESVFQQERIDLEYLE